MAGGYYFGGSAPRKPKVDPQIVYDNYSEEEQRLLKQLGRANGEKPHFPLPSFAKQGKRKKRLHDLRTRLIPNVVRVLSS